MKKKKIIRMGSVQKLNKLLLIGDYVEVGCQALHIHKVTCDSLLIHVFAYLLFIGPCSVTSNMTGYSHSYHSIKLIHCGTPQRDVLSDKLVL